MEENRTNETRSQFFEKINKDDKSLAKLTKQSERKLKLQKQA